MRFIALAAILARSVLGAAALDSGDRQLAHDILKQLIEINTTHSVGSTTVAAHAIKDRLLAAGFSEQDMTILGPNDKRGNLIVRYRAANPTHKPILIIAHLDVVEARRADWSSDPFQLVEKDGYFYGRGTQDMKAADAVLVTDFIRLRREHYLPDRDIIVAFTADEESGTANGVDWLLKHHRELIDAEYVLNPDSGGVYTDNGKPVDVEMEVTEKLYATFQVRATNPGGHSSLPVPDNAIYRVVDALARLEHSPFPFELNSVTRAYFAKLASAPEQPDRADMQGILQTPPDEAAAARLSRQPQYNSLLHTTCVPTMMEAGHAENALPQNAVATVNCRILPGHSAEEVRQDLVRTFADPQLTVRFMDVATGEPVDHAPGKQTFAPVLPPPAVLQPLERIAHDMWPGAPVIPEMETGASDSVYTIAAGMPSYGVSGLAIDRNDIRAHGKDERVRMSSYYEGVEFYYRYLKALTSRAAASQAL
jgi:acetylornithine deacetylase/succinyl-diaminopimelate desuccinylase-like protein